MAYKWVFRVQLDECGWQQDERKLQNGHADTGAILGTSDLRHSGTVPNAGRISGCYRPNHFYESLAESSYNPIKLIMFCYLLRVRGTGYREATHLTCRMTSPLPA